jgi:hypothetical protein
MRSECAFIDVRSVNASGVDFDFNQRKIKPLAPDAFDKCSVFEFKNSALFMAFAFQDIKDIKRRRTLRCSAHARGGASSGAINLKTRDAKDPGMTSNAFDFFQTDSRQSAEFLNFNQSFLFKRDGENALTRFAELPSEALAKEGRNSPIELKEARNVRCANSLQSGSPRYFSRRRPLLHLKFSRFSISAHCR